MPVQSTAEHRYLPLHATFIDFELLTCNSNFCQPSDANCHSTYGRLSLRLWKRSLHSRTGSSERVWFEVITWSTHSSTLNIVNQYIFRVLKRHNNNISNSLEYRNSTEKMFCNIFSCKNYSDACFDKYYTS